MNGQTAIAKPWTVNDGRERPTSALDRQPVSAAKETFIYVIL
jgi:hypothetical protein